MGKVSKIEAEKGVFRSQMEESQKLHEAKTQELSEMTKVNDEAKSKVSKIEAEKVLLKSQLEESQKLHEAKTQELSEMTKANDEAKLRVIEIEAEKVVLKSQLDESKKLNDSLKKKNEAENSYWKNSADIDLKEQLRIHTEDKAKICEVHEAAVKELQDSLKLAKKKKNWFS